MRIVRLAILVIAITTPVAASPDTPFAGQVTTSLSKPLAALPLAVRKAPPTADGSTYRRGEYICAAFPGTTFFATDKVVIGNGETWYSVQISSRGENKAACSPGTTGWMIGKLKGGTQVITVQTPGAVPSTASTSMVAAAKPEVANLQHETEPESPGRDYILLLLGTTAAVVLMTWERDRKISAGALARPLTIVELVVFWLASVTVLALLMPVYFQIDAESVTTRAIQRLVVSPGGHILLGFAVSVALMKTVSFTRAG